VYSFAWRDADARIQSVKAKLSSGTGTFNISKSANGISATDSDEGIGSPKWHLMIDDLSKPGEWTGSEGIGSWYSHTKDSSGVINRFVSGSQSSSPSYSTTSGPGSTEGASFDGSNDILIMSAGTTKMDFDGSFTVFAVIGDFDVNENQNPIIGNSDITNSSYLTMWGHKGGDLRVRNDSKNEFNFNQDDITPDELRVMTCDNASPTKSDVSEYVDGGTKYSAESITISSNGGWSFNAIGGMQRDRNGSPQSRLFEGSLSELIMYPRLLGTDQRQLIEGYLAHKWGLTLNVGHPFVSTNPFATSFAATSDIVLTSSYPVTGTTAQINVSLGDTVTFYMPNLQNPGTLSVELTYDYS
jgi:hypothetical protein